MTSAASQVNTRRWAPSLCGVHAWNTSVLVRKISVVTRSANESNRACSRLWSALTRRARPGSFWTSAANRATPATSGRIPRVGSNTASAARCSRWPCSTCRTAALNRSSPARPLGTSTVAWATSAPPSVSASSTSAIFEGG